MLSPPSAARLAKLAGMIGSDHDGEALNAARAATRLLASNGLTWGEALAVPAPQVITNQPRNDRAPGPYPVPPTTMFVRKVLACRDNPALFDQVERQFIRSMDNYALGGRQPTAKQGAWLDRLHARALDYLATVTV